MSCKNFLDAIHTQTKYNLFLSKAEQIFFLENSIFTKVFVNPKKKAKI